MENDDENTVLNTTFDTGSDQHHPQMPVHTSPLRCQSTPPRTDTVRMLKTPVPVVPTPSHRSLTPCIPLPKSQNSSSSLSQMSALLFIEGRYSSSSDDDLEVCVAEITLINRQNRPNQTFTHHSAKERPTSTPTTMDYTTQGDLNQVGSPIYINTVQTTTQDQFCHTNNFFIPDGSNRCIHKIRDNVFHAGYLENGNNAYLLELPGLKDMLHTSRFLMDKKSGQFYVVYGNTYQYMSTKPMLEWTWGTGELIDQLPVMQHAFGYTGPSGPMPPLNQSQPTASTTYNQQDDTLSKKPAPKTVPYQPPSFNLDRPTMHLTMEERIQVHHNYIFAISNCEHKKNLINRLKRSDLHNILAYEAEMTHHMVLHDDVLGRILTILKQDDYYRTLEELPVIDSLTTYDDIQLFPKLYDTTTIIARVTGEADLIKRQLRQPGMYPSPLPPHLKLYYLLLRVLYQDLLLHFSLLHQLHHQNQLTHTIQTDKMLKPHQKVHYPVDNGHLYVQQALTAHQCNIHHHSQLCPHNLLHLIHTTQKTYTHTHNPKIHHNHLPLHNLSNSLLLGQILIWPPSLSFQLQRHINLYPAHHHSMFLSL